MRMPDALRIGLILAGFVSVAGTALRALPAPETPSALPAPLSPQAPPAQSAPPASQALPAPPALCVISGRVTNGATPLPGVSIVAMHEGRVLGATSTDTSGAFRLRLPPGDYTVSAELAAFATFEGSVTVGADAAVCASTLDVPLVLASRVQSSASPASSSNIEAPASLRRPGRLGGPGAAAGQSRFAQLQVVEANTAAAAENALAAIEETDPAARLLPPGFSTEAATSVVAVTGDAVNLDRGQLRDRLEALGRGEFAAAGAQPPDGFGGPFGGPGGPGGFGGGPGGPGGGQGLGGRGGPGGGPLLGQGGRGGFAGRGRGANAFQGSANYGFGGSVLDATPYPIRVNTQQDPDYTRQQFGATIGGPLRIPGAYDGSRTTFFLNYAGGRSSSLVERYATVPTAAMRAGDFSSLGIAPVDPTTGLPFADGRIPQGQIDPASLALLEYIPVPNLPGSTQNYRRSAAALSTTDGFNVRVTHNFTAAAAGRRGGGAGGRGGGFGRGAGAGGRGRSGTSVVLNAQAQYRRNDADDINVFPLLGGVTAGTSWSIPISVNVLKGRTVHNVQVSATRTTSSTRNGFAGITDVAGLAGISGVATDPGEWGVPTVSFSSLTSLNDVSPDRRRDRRVQASYTLTRPLQRHTLRAGGDMRFDASDGRTNSDGRGTFVFTGLYSAGGPTVGSGLDFADFLLGRPQQASVQFAGDVALRGRAFSLFLQDDWRLHGNLTLNLGIRYEVVRPYTESGGRMVNLDVAPDFTGAVPVVSGGSGLYTGAFPASLVDGDYNNLGPRLGVAWRMTPRTIVRGGYGMGFNNGSYASIARQLVAQPPFAVASTSIGSLESPLFLTDAFAEIDESTTTNTFGVDRTYQLGVIHTWNVDVTRNVGRGWQVGGGYTGTRGTHLDLLRAPNRGPDGLRIEGVQPFLWQTSEGTSILHSATFRLRKQQTRGIAGNVSYTLAKSMDDASSVGGGARVVAQDDQNLDAEWGLSSFDRRHQLNGTLSIELPFGSNRRWLNDGGIWAAALSDWTVAASYSALSGTPLTARVIGSSSDVARGTNGTLRADYTGAPVQIDDGRLLRFFNTAAFVVPEPGTFGSAGRNTIIGPSQQQLDASIARDVRLTGNQVISIQVQAANLFNSVRFGAVDTVVNSPTYGQVISIRPMRSVQLNMRFRF